MYITLAGFPRSGNTFLRYSLFNMYPSIYFNRPIHTVKFLEEYLFNDKIVMPIRKPEDCISSWIELKHTLINDAAVSNRFRYDINDVDGAINYYIRYFDYVLKIYNKVLFLNFDIFKNDLSYVKYFIDKEFNIKAEKIPSIEGIKNILIENEAYTQIPRSDKSMLNYIKQNVINNKNIEKANHIYERLQYIMEKRNV